MIMQFELENRLCLRSEFNDKQNTKTITKLWDFLLKLPCNWEGREEKGKLTECEQTKQDNRDKRGKGKD